MNTNVSTSGLTSAADHVVVVGVDAWPTVVLGVVQVVPAVHTL